MDPRDLVLLESGVNHVEPRTKTPDSTKTLRFKWLIKELSKRIWFPLWIKKHVFFHISRAVHGTKTLHYMSLPYISISIWSQLLESQKNNFNMLLPKDVMMFCKNGAPGVLWCLNLSDPTWIECVWCQSHSWLPTNINHISCKSYKWATSHMWFMMSWFFNSWSVFFACGSSLWQKKADMKCD